MNLSIRITGGGTADEIASALLDIVELLTKDADYVETVIAENGDWESDDPTLALYLTDEE